MQKKKMITKNGMEQDIQFSRNSIIKDMMIMIILCMAGLFLKKMINPFVNVVTDTLHVPGGISTAISLMFLVIASGITSTKCNATIMGVMQVAAALAMGTIGSMGLLMPLAYIIPGVVIDLVMLIPDGFFPITIKSFVANILGSAVAAIFADIVVFHLPLKALSVYICLAVLSGAICGFIAGTVSNMYQEKRGNKNEEIK